MRILLIVLMILVLNTFAYGQDSETRIENPITQKNLLALPRRNAVPSLTLQRALKIAETYLKKERLGISSRYLFEAKWVSYDTDPESGAWEFWWVSTKYGSDDVRIAVSLDGKPKRLPIPGATGRRHAPDAPPRSPSSILFGRAGDAGREAGRSALTSHVMPRKE